MANQARPELGVFLDPSKILEQLRGPAPMMLDDLMHLWAVRGADGWLDAEIYRRFGERAFKLGEPLAAYDFLAEGIARGMKDLQLRQWFVRALARTGATDRAIEELEKLRRDTPGDVQTLGLLGSIAKKRRAEATTPAEARRSLREAARYYGQAYACAIANEATPADTRVWVGINAATTAELLGNRKRALTLAREVARLCERALQTAAADDPDRYWFRAAIAEAALIRHDLRAARKNYRLAAADAQGRFGDLGTTRRQARMLARHFRMKRDAFDDCFPFPTVIRFAGHMIDRPGRRPPRFPPELEDAVRKAIVRKLNRLKAGFGFGSAACGSDILFQEAMQRRGNETHIVLPYDKDEFRKASVDIIPGADWGKRYYTVLASATRTIFASNQKTAGSYVTYQYANDLVSGLAALRAHSLGAELVLLAVWDGRSGDGAGGTKSIVESWRGLGRRVEIIKTEPMLKRVKAIRRPAVASPSFKPVENVAKEVTALLFADVVGFSELNEDQIPGFVRGFLGRIAARLSATPHVPLLRSTWGDGLYLVFEDIRGAGLLALELQELVESTAWKKLGLSKNLQLRIGVRAGPTYRCVDPITTQTNYTGAHVSRAARIEPITPPNQVYASQAFVALAAANDVRDFEWDYVGVVPLAKKYGDAPMYHLRRRYRAAP